MFDAIAARRSIRKFKNTPVPRHIIEEIIKAGALAPSSKNRQPWHFVVTTGKAKEEALAAMEQGLRREAQQPLLPESAQYIAGAWNTLAIMRQAPVIIFVVNTLGLDLLTPQNAENRVFEICNAQSIGAAVENMSLAAVEAGLGSLWICDTYFAQQELCTWLGGELAAAFALPCGVFGRKALLNVCGRLCAVYLLCPCGVYSLLFAVSRGGELIVAHTLVSLDTGDDTQSDNAAVVYHGDCECHRREHRKTRKEAAAFRSVIRGDHTEQYSDCFYSGQYCKDNSYSFNARSL